MSKEILLYGSIYSGKAETFINQMEESKNKDVKVRVNTPGGEVTYGWGMIAKFKEHLKAKEVQVDGDASSMGLMFVLYADKVSAVNTARLIMHRASYGEWYEKSEFFPQVLKDDLAAMNKDMEAAVRKRIDVAKFEKLKGVAIADIFALDKRLEVRLSAPEAIEIGLIDEIIDLNSDLKLKASIETNLLASAEVETGLKLAARVAPPAQQQFDFNTENPDTTMTIEKLKAEFPAIYAAIHAEGHKAGVAEENDRVGAWLAWMDIDAKRVKEGIEKNEKITAKVSNELQVTAMKASALGKLEDESAKAVTTDGGAAAATPAAGTMTAAQKAVADFEKELDKNKPAAK